MGLPVVARAGDGPAVDVPPSTIMLVLREHFSYAHALFDRLRSTWKEQGKQNFLGIPSAQVREALRWCPGCQEAKAVLPSLPIRSSVPHCEWQIDHKHVSALPGWGKEKLPISVAGHGHMLALYHCASRVVFGRSTKTKSGVDVGRFLCDWHVWARGQGIIRPGQQCVIRADGAKELIEGKAAEAAVSLGVAVEAPPPDSSDSKGGVERFWRTAAESVRATMKTWGVPRRYWGDVYAGVIDAYNSTASPVDGKSPFRRATNARPDLSVSFGRVVRWKPPGVTHKDIVHGPACIGVVLSKQSSCCAHVLRWGLVSKKWIAVSKVHPSRVLHVDVGMLLDSGLASRLRLVADGLRGPSPRDVGVLDVPAPAAAARAPAADPRRPRVRQLFMDAGDGEDGDDRGDDPPVEGDLPPLADPAPAPARFVLHRGAGRGGVSIFRERSGPRGARPDRVRCDIRVAPTLGGGAYTGSYDVSLERRVVPESEVEYFHMEGDQIPQAILDQLPALPVQPEEHVVDPDPPDPQPAPPSPGPAAAAGGQAVPAQPLDDDDLDAGLLGELDDVADDQDEQAMRCALYDCGFDDDAFAVHDHAYAARGKTMLPATREDEVTGKFDEAQLKELNSFVKQKVFGPEISPAEVRRQNLVPVPMRWVLNWKLQQDGSRKPKARLVLAGHSGNDHRVTETYASTPDCTLFRLMLIFIVMMKWVLLVADVTTAFLQTPLTLMDSAITVVARFVGRMPPGAEALGLRAGRMYRLQKAVYGMRDSPRLFQRWFRDDVLIPNGWKEVEPSLYVQSPKPLPSLAICDDQSITETDKILITALLQMYVDDGVCASPDPTSFVQSVRRRGVAIDDGDIIGPDGRQVIGRRLCVSRGRYATEDQEKYITPGSIVGDGKRKDAVVARDFEEPDPAEVDLSLKSDFATMLGMLGWLTRTRWDLAYAFSALGRHSAAPSVRAMKCLRSVLRLSIDNPRRLRFVPVSKPELRLYVDASWNERKCTSRSGYVFQLASEGWPHLCYDNIFSWGSNQETRFVRSAPGAELLALVKGLLKAPLLLRFARLLFGKGVRLLVKTDSQTLLDQLAAGHVSKEQSLQGRLAWAMQEKASMKAEVSYVNTKEQLADCLTKWIHPQKTWPLTGAGVGVYM